MVVFLEVFRRVFTLQVVLAGVVFVLVTGLLLAAVWRNRATRRAEPPFARAEHPVLEGGFAVLLAGVAGFLVWLSLSANHTVTDPGRPAGASAVGLASANARTHIAVTAFQWCWRFDYREAPVRVTGTCADRATAPTLVVPAGQPVELSLTSSDVVHAMWIPDLAIKKDAMPDHVNTLTVTFDRPGQWLGRCSEYCGTHHMTMDFYVKAVPADQYQRWLSHGGQA